MAMLFSGKIRFGILRSFYKVRHSIRKRWACIRTLWFFLCPGTACPGVLFVSRSFLARGGVETRVRKYASVWNKLGYRVYIASVWEEGSGRDVSFFLTSCAAKNDKLLKTVVKKRNIRVIEWQAGGPEPPLFDLSLLQKQGVRTGVMVHAARKEWDFAYLRNTHYKACSSPVQVRRAALLARVPVLPNAVERRPAVWRYAGQQKAVIISRISEDKLPSLAAFIRLCQCRGLAYDIAGPVDSEPARKTKQSLQAQFGIKEAQFIGGVSAEDFLAAHAGEYLFVGGVGQVILEAGQLGFPCLVAGLAGAEHSCFVSRTNFRTLYGYNFSPRMPEALAEIKSFCAVCAADFAALRRGDTARFDIASLVREFAGLEEMLKRYERLALEK